MIAKLIDSWIGALIAERKRRERDALLEKHGVLLRCPWCRQVGNTQQTACMTVGPEPNREGRAHLRCGVCEGGSTWLFGVAPVVVLEAATTPPVPRIEGQLRPAKPEPEFEHYGNAPPPGEEYWP